MPAIPATSEDAAPVARTPMDHCPFCRSAPSLRGKWVGEIYAATVACSMGCFEGPTVSVLQDMEDAVLQAVRNWNMSAPMTPMGVALAKLMNEPARGLRGTLAAIFFGPRTAS